MAKIEPAIAIKLLQAISDQCYQFYRRTRDSPCKENQASVITDEDAIADEGVVTDGGSIVRDCSRSRSSGAKRLYLRLLACRLYVAFDTFFGSPQCALQAQV